MSVLIEYPSLALIPAMLFLAGYRVSRKRLALAASIAWLCYSGYEYGMSRRWLCTGECNIRIDLLLLYPVLVLTSVAAAVVVFRALARRRRSA